jgi:hypothetical protein
MQVLQAIAKSAPRQVTTRYGEKLVIDATGQNGEQVTIWRPATDRSPAINSITNGSRIAVGMDSKGKYSLLETPGDRAAEVAQKPISPTIEPLAEARPMGFTVEAPFEMERRLRAQMAAAQPVAIEPTSPAIDARIAELGRVYAQCLAVAGGSELAAVEIFKAAIA